MKKRVKMQIIEKNKYGTLNYLGIENFEQQYGHKLPEEYKEFLLTYNGGKSDSVHFNISSGVSEIHGPFYGLHNGPYHTRLDLINNDLINSLPNELLAIATDPGGNQICINTSIQNQGKIAFWDQNAINEIEYLSDTFAQFLDCLFKWEPPGKTEIEKYIEDENIQMLNHFLDSNSPDTIIELDRTIIEIATIKNKLKIIELLNNKGASLRNAYKLAQQNAVFFPDHQKSVQLLKTLYKI